MDSLSELDSLSRTRRVDELTTSSHFKGLVVPLLVAAVDCLIIFDSFSLAYLLRFRWQLAFSYAEPAPPVTATRPPDPPSRHRTSGPCLSTHL